MKKNQTQDKDLGVKSFSVQLAQTTSVFIFLHFFNELSPKRASHLLGMVDTCSSGLTGPSLMVCAVKWLVHSRSSRPGREHTVNICWLFQTWVNDIAKADCFFQLPFRKVYMEGILYALAIQRASILAFGSFLELWGDQIFFKKYWEFELNLMRFFFFSYSHSK